MNELQTRLCKKKKVYHNGTLVLIRGERARANAKNVARAGQLNQVGMERPVQDGFEQRNRFAVCEIPYLNRRRQFLAGATKISHAGKQSPS